MIWNTVFQALALLMIPVALGGFGWVIAHKRIP